MHLYETRSLSAVLFQMDSLSTLMIPKDVPSQVGKLQALESMGDGNCLFNAVSILLTGNLIWTCKNILIT